MEQKLHVELPVLLRSHGAEEMKHPPEERVIFLFLLCVGSRRTDKVRVDGRRHGVGSWGGGGVSPNRPESPHRKVLQFGGCPN